ncbi:MAG: tetratricopeptide repeat protein [Sandaracinaceae bacterium]|nr:tetratricopeptide repeat protein [Sandaracinaceae bacterium]
MQAAHVCGRMTRALVLWLVLLGLGASTAVHAQPPAQVEQARQLFVDGTTHYQAGRLDQALRCFLDAWRIVPSPELAYNVARTYERMGDAQHGIEFYRNYLRRAAPDAAERQDVERRIADLESIARRQREQIIAMPPSDDELTREARTFFERGVAMFRRRNYQAAMAAFTAAYSFARLPEVIYNLAVTAERLDRTQDAIDYFREYQRSLPADSVERPMIDRRVQELRARLDR